MRVLLETTAGQGTSLGHRFEQLAAILEQVEAAPRVGLCLDTCHPFAAGYDIRSPRGLPRDDAGAGNQRAGDNDAPVQAIHLNDSRQGLGSRVDRHAHIGEGMSGSAAFRFFLNDPASARFP